VANTGIVSSELYKAGFGLQTVEVKYKDPQTLLNDLWGGNLAFTHLGPPGTLAHIKSGKLRALATSSRDRRKALPDIASAREVEIGDADIVGWWSVHTPKGTPKDIRDRLEIEFNAIAASDDNVRFLTATGSDPLIGNSEMLHKLLANEIKAWAEYVKLAKIEQI
jgi:tripartite-type tricarboxylate transporter receptor subunit TctC